MTHVHCSVVDNSNWIKAEHDYLEHRYYEVDEEIERTARPGTKNLHTSFLIYQMLLIRFVLTLDFYDNEIQHVFMKVWVKINYASNILSAKLIETMAVIFWSKLYYTLEVNLVIDFG